MRKVLLLFFVLFLTACGSNELDQALVDDTDEILEILDSVVYDGEDLSQEDREIIGEYLDHYGNKELDEKDKELYNRMWHMLEYPDEAIRDLETYEVNRMGIVEAIE